MPPNRDQQAGWRAGPAGWGIAEEAAVEIGFRGQPWTVMMASPLELEDLALGLAYTEGLITPGADLPAVSLRRWPEGWSADIGLDPDKLPSGGLRKRNLDGVTGCGLCGVETLAEALRRPPGLDGRARITGQAIETAFEALPPHQALNAATRTVHAAAWCSPAGEIVLVREDVGRHNALDKLAGALLRSNRLGEDGFIVMTSRCSFELVAKASMTSAGVLATLSAPTGMAIDLAGAAGLPLACRGDGGGVVWFARGDDNA
ncbi:formate dehydrogenase accessory sulfurtransferase FdhD [Hyphobacterium sp. HN65]|uniref:Formate dehydrogenase accessory sulfurtransferase FdhD n=1 Tax=Hyphobacterium lacteum TaxID=3116575 RepID=A0ABU7LT29_9PROT|nr:formate dehydrogenase accessory sulfurtransferase FdhD [Hyphobacterium sp. HN65]MEE2526801.1 formate dehydrogenase accessory sulfurtransferase FdhD [Hyphobacterium sp. HN65]